MISKNEGIVDLKTFRISYHWRVSETVFIVIFNKLWQLRLLTIKSIFFLIIMKDQGVKVFQLVKTNSALDFLKIIPHLGGYYFWLNSRNRVLTTTNILKCLYDDISVNFVFRKYYPLSLGHTALLTCNYQSHPVGTSVISS